MAEERVPGLVIFDCDGVLVDSEATSNHILAEAITDAGLPMEAEAVTRSFEGMRLEDIQTAVEGRLGRSLPAGWLAAFEARRAAAFRNGIEAIPGAAQTLGELRTAQVPICVASQASFEKTQLTLGLTGLLELFEAGALFSSRMVAHGKPHPDLFLFAAAKMEVDPPRCMVVEDGVLGVRGARAAGMRVLGYAPDGQASRLQSEGAEIFSSMREVPARLGLSLPER
jgi:HAD superfamily hydrolase (TIGR01509 family)